MRTLWVLIIPVLCLSAQEIPRDYSAYLAAAEAQKLGRHVDSLQSLETVWSFRPESPLIGKASLTAARSYLALQRGRDALDLLQKNLASLPQPEGYALLAEASEAAGDPAGSVRWWQKVYYGHPLSEQAIAADAALGRLRATLGREFPHVPAQAMFDRAEKLRRAGQPARAKRELLAAMPGLAVAERELALVHASHGDYRSLSTIRVKTREAEAERLYLMHAAARRNSMEAQADGAMRQLDQTFPNSKWTMEALISWGNHHLLRNNTTEFEPLYRACYERFPQDPQAAWCHWKVVWSAWMQRAPNARTLMEDHVARFPDSDKRSAALYFLGRYDEVIRLHPMSWYAVLSQGKSRTPSQVSRPDPERFTPTPSLMARIRRARQLETAGMTDWAEFELLYAAAEQPFVAAMNLAEVAAGRGAHDQALRYIKTVAKGYLMLPFEAAPESFWKLAFPMPYRSELDRHSRENGLDRNLVAALIRQESEFNPRAVSRARAYGLTQVLPSTGRQISRHVGIARFRPAMLFEPGINIRLGAWYLRSMLDTHGGRWEVTLAAYNAGKTRTDLWQSWYDYREPAEFVETIPFTETRNYVQIVLRNADVYRRLYGESDNVRASR